MSTVQNIDVHLDDVDLRILRELEVDGRQSISALAKKLGISRAYAGKRMQNLLDRKITRIVAFTQPQVLGFRTVALIGIQVSLSELHTAANRLRALPSVQMVMIAAGRHNIVAWAMFADPMDLSSFLTSELGNIPGIKSTETSMVLEWRKMSFSYMASSNLGITGPQPQEASVHEPSVAPSSDLSIDELDLEILQELEEDGRQPVSYLAKKLGTSRAYMSARLQRILDLRITRIVAHTNPMALGYRIFAMIGIKVVPSDINAIADKLCRLTIVHGVAVMAGQHDIIIWAMFPTPVDLATFLERDLGNIPGIISAECTILLELKKMSFPFLVRSHLAAISEPGAAAQKSN